MAAPPENRSTTDLLADIANETSALLRSEVQLAKTEISERISQLESGAVLLAAGGIVAFSGFLILLLAAVFALANVVEPWLSALIIGIIVVAVGAAMLAKGRNNMKSTNLAPNRTIRSVEKDADLARSEMRR